MAALFSRAVESLVRIARGRPVRIVLMGPPAAGKGTHAALLSKKFRIPHISASHLMSMHPEAEEWMLKGMSVPFELADRLIAERLSQPDAAKGFVLEGYPSGARQAQALHNFLAAKNMPPTVAFLLRAPRAELERRLAERFACEKCKRTYATAVFPPKVAGVCNACGSKLFRRADDAPEIVKNRLDKYERNSAALADFYKSRGLLMEIDVSRGTRKGVRKASRRMRRAVAVKKRFQKPKI